MGLLVKTLDGNHEVVYWTKVLQTSETVTGAAGGAGIEAIAGGDAGVGAIVGGVIGGIAGHVEGSR
jgi:hypothetical protein